MPCKDRCDDDDDGPPSASTPVGAFRNSPGGQQPFLKIASNVSCFGFIPCVFMLFLREETRLNVGAGSFSEI